MKLNKLIVAFAIGVAVAAGIFAALRSQQPAVPVTAMILPDPDPVPAFELVDQRGTPIDESVFRGQWDLVFFGFTHCPDVCPTTLQVLATAITALDERGVTPLPRIVLVSVDPERDTPRYSAATSITSARATSAFPARSTAFARSRRDSASTSRNRKPTTTTTSWITRQPCSSWIPRDASVRYSADRTSPQTTCTTCRY